MFSPFKFAVSFVWFEMVVLFLSSLNLPFSFIHSSPLSAVAALYTWTVKFCHVADICFHGNGIFSPWKPCFMSFSTECFYIKERTILFWLEGTAHVHHGYPDHFARSCSSRLFHGSDVLFKMFLSDHIHQKSKQKNRFCFLPGSLSTTYATAIHVCVWPALLVWNRQSRRTRRNQCFLFYQLRIVIMPCWAVLFGQYNRNVMTSTCSHVSAVASDCWVPYVLPIY